MNACLEGVLESFSQFGDRLGTAVAITDRINPTRSSARYPNPRKMSSLGRHQPSQWGGFSPNPQPGGGMLAFDAGRT